MPSRKIGLLYALSAFLIWGFFPIIWKSLGILPPILIFSYRIIFSFCFLFVAIRLKHKHPYSYLRSHWHKYKKVLIMSTILIACNWYFFVLAIDSGQIRQGSLGYYLNPLFSVVLGFLILKEKITRNQLLALILGSLGSIFFLLAYGSFPYYSFILAGTFGLYGLVRRKSQMNGLAAITWETFLTLPLAVFFVLKDLATSQHTLNLNYRHWILVVFGGAFTAIALWLFGEAANKVNLALLGLLQYISPTLQFMIAIFIYSEPINQGTLASFSLIWLALVLVAKDQIRFLVKSTKITNIVKNY